MKSGIKKVVRKAKKIKDDVVLGTKVTIAKEQAKQSVSSAKAKLEDMADDFSSDAEDSLADKIDRGVSRAKKALGDSAMNISNKITEQADKFSSKLTEEIEKRNNK